MQDKRKDMEAVDKARDKLLAGTSKAPKVKHKEYRPCTCKQCHNVSFKGDKTFGYCCVKCGKYNSTDDAAELYESGVGEMEESHHCKDENLACNFQTMDDGKIEYRKFRDENEIRADMFIKGMTRDSMGVQKFDKALKKELIKNKCYRGAHKIGI